MNRPYIVCHMMATIDGRIDCPVMEKLEGTKEYYDILEELNVPATVSGKVTAQLEIAEKGEFVPENIEVFGKEGFSKKVTAEGYGIVVDTRGTLLWKDGSEYETPVLVITSEKVTKEYLAYLDSKNISWIACGAEKIDLGRAVEILAENFGVQRMGIVGGGTINGAFLDAGLLDEITMLFAPGIDGRKGMAASFDGLPMDREPVLLNLKSATPYSNGAVLLKYTIKK